ncbi:MAG: fumarate/nitrate reduction transcriptional regulator Fnr [Betaproteobacteria bacterium]
MARPELARQQSTHLVLAELKAACANCNLRELCLPAGLTNEELEQLDTMVNVRRKIKRGESLYRAGETFDAIYAIRSGFFKSRVTYEDGRDQVTGFSMGGEILGMDGIGQGIHNCDAVALEDSEVCSIPYARLEDLSREINGLQRHFHKMMSREIVRESGVMMLLGVMRAEERIAAFLLNISQRLGARGYSPLEFHLRMTREEIGSYLGLKLETVSRAFSKFHADGLITVDQKFVKIVDLQGLKNIYAHHVT